MRAASQSLSVIMLRPPESPRSSCGRIFPKNWLLSLISSTYLTSTPVAFSNSATVPRLPGSMYSVHWANVNEPLTLPFFTKGALFPASLDVAVSSVPQPAARTAAASAAASMRRVIPDLSVVSRIRFHKLTGMRPRNQAHRRRQLANAGRRVILERGAVGVRVKDIAERAGIAPSSVLYYYPRLDDLMIEVSREAMERYAERRSGRVRKLTDPAGQLRLAIHLGVPTGPDDEESRLLYELDAFVGSSPAFGILTSSYFDRQVMLYQSVLESGAARGAFDLAAPADSLARGIVAMEDGL